MGTSVNVSQIGLDVHRKFSKVTARGSDGKVAWRQRLEHADRVRLREHLERWPKGTPVVLEGTFGWGWISDELEAAGLDPHLASSRKVAGWRKARGLAKSNRTDADLVSIHAIMHRHGILREQSDLFGRDGRRFLSLLVAPQDATLPDSARATLKGYLQRVHATLGGQSTRVSSPVGAIESSPARQCWEKRVPESLLKSRRDD